MGKMMSKDFYCLRNCDIIAPFDKNGAIMKNTRKLIYTAMMTAIIAACSWISIPAVVPFTLQTFAVFCALGAVLFENLAERSCAFGFLTPHRLGAYILSQRLYKEIDKIAYDSPKRSK